MLWLEEALLGLFADDNNDIITCASFASHHIALVALGTIIVSVAC